MAKKAGDSTRKKATAAPAAKAVEPEAPAPEGPDEAAEAGEAVGSADNGRILVFQLDGQRYALMIDVVQEIQQIVAFSEIPDVSPSIVGVINLRGQVVPVVDLRVLLGLERRAYDLQTPMIFCRTSRGIAALVVDEVEDVLEVPPGCMQPPSRVTALADRMLGVCRFDSDLVFVFDIDALIPAEASEAAR